MAQPQPAAWAVQELNSADLSDKRLNRRLLLLASQLADDATASIPQACGDWPRTKGAYRFFDHDAVDSQAILEAHRQATRGRVQRHGLILVPQDTTSFNYSRHDQTVGLGPIGDEVDGPQGFFMHEALALTEQGEPLGVIFAKWWARDPADFRKAQKRKERSLEEKESGKWLEGWRATEALARQVPQTQVVNICDREGDVYELFEAAVQTQCPNAAVLVRLRHNRRAQTPADEPEQTWRRLDACLAAQPQATTRKIPVPRHEDQPARKAVVSIRFCPITLRAPTAKAHLPNLSLYLVEARELNPPAGVDAICWRLLTTYAVTTAQTAARMIRWYAKRWQIEVFHKVLKSGCRVEQRQLETAARLQRLLAVYLVVAWRIQAMTWAARQHPDLPASLWLEEPQWQTLACWMNHTSAPPRQPPTVRDAVQAIAKLGGFLGRKGDGQPGTICLWRGLRRLSDMTLGSMLKNL